MCRVILFHKAELCPALPLHVKCPHCFKRYQLNVVPVEFAFCECVVMIYNITLFPIKLAIFCFPSQDFQNLRFPTTLARLGKAYYAARLRCIL